MRRIWLLPALAALLIGLAGCGGSGEEAADEAPATTAAIETAASEGETGAPAEAAAAETGLAANAEAIRAILDSTVAQLSGARSIGDVATILTDAGARAQAQADSLPGKVEAGFEDDVAQLRQGLISLGDDLERIAGELRSSGPGDAQEILSEIQRLPAIEQINQALSSIAIAAS